MSKERIVKFGRNGEAREAIELSEREGRVPNYKVNDAAVQNAEKLIRDGKVDSDTDWSDGQPSTDDENRFIEDHGYDAFGEWYLAIDPDASEDTKSRYAFPFGDFEKVYRDGVTSAKQRAAQNDHDAIERAADQLLKKLGE